MQIKPRLIIGLGNPSKEYEKTYHNAGFLFVDSLAGGDFDKNKTFIFTKDKNFVLIKPLVFMNESGKAVSGAIKYFSSAADKIKPENILIVHDDSDIVLGDYKVSFGRSSAGHRGVESVIKSLKTKNFWRLRIGIRRGTTRKKTRNCAEKISVSPRLKAGELVLKKISAGDLKILLEEFKEIKKIIFNV